MELYGCRSGRETERGPIQSMIIYMKKLLDSVWLRTVQFFLNTVQKKGNGMQEKVIEQAF